MSVENSEYTEAGEPVHKSVNGDQEQRINGLTNGHVDSNSSSKHHHHHKSSSSKSKHRDRDRDREKNRDHKSSKSSSSSNRDKESSDKHKSSSTNSSSKDKHRDKDREKDRDKDKDRHKSSSSSHKSSRDKDRNRDKERNKDKDRSEKDKERQNKDKERSKENSDHVHSNEKREQHSSSGVGVVVEGVEGEGVEKKKEHKSSSNSTNSHHHRHSSSNKDKDRSSSHSHKDRDRDRDRHKSSKDKHSSSNHSSSRSKDKHSSSSSKDKDRHRSDKEKHNSSSNKDVNNSSNINNHQLNNDNQQQKQHDVLDSGAIPTIKEELKAEENEYNNHHPFRRFQSHFVGVGNHLLPPSGHEYKPEIKDEHTFNISQASSCDYSMSQFRDDEPNFITKEEATDDDSQEARDPLSFTVGPEENDEDDVPLSKRKVVHESDDDIPLINRKKPKLDQSSTKVDKNKKVKKKKRDEMEDDYLDEKPKKKKIKKQEPSPVKLGPPQTSPTKGRKKKEEEPEEVWRWWEEEKRQDGVKWVFLEHKGPVFAPEYEPLPDNVHFYYDGKRMKLSNDAEEVATFYAKMLNHDYVTKEVFNSNFFKDWRKSMTSKEREMIKDLRKCNFQEMHEFFLAESEKRKNRTKEEKQAVKEENERLIQEYGFCIIDGHKERIGNFKLEPPGLFRGRGEHPKMGLVKRRIMPEDVLINCSKNSKIPQPPPGHRWREVRHDNSVTWLASWTENIQGQVKYIMLNPSSKLKGEKDYQKYETARRLDKHVDKIRATYRDEWKSKEMRIRQRGVALYFIDNLALRAGNEKDEDQADTVGCCSLRVEHVKLFKELNGKENVVVFDFLGKDSIRYYNEVEVEKRVFKNLELFMENKKDGDDLFDRLNTAVLNEHLKELMDGLTAKVFRTYNASITLQKQLDELTDPDSSIPEKLLSYNRANRAVALLCNHQRSVPKTHAKSMETLKEKIRLKQEQVDDAEADLQTLRKQAKRGSVKEKVNADKKAKQLEKLKEQLKKLELQVTDKDENKTIALGTSKLNYLDPRISVAWCKKYGVPIEKIFNKTQREKFRWAIHMADENYRF